MNTITKCKAPDKELQQCRQQKNYSEVHIIFHLIRFVLLKPTKTDYRMEQRCRLSLARCFERALCLKPRFQTNTLKVCTTSKNKQHLTP